MASSAAAVAFKLSVRARCPTLTATSLDELLVQLEDHGCTSLRERCVAEVKGHRLDRMSASRERVARYPPRYKHLPCHT